MLTRTPPVVCVSVWTVFVERTLGLGIWSRHPRHSMAELRPRSMALHGASASGSFKQPPANLVVRALPGHAALRQQTSQHSRSSRHLPRPSRSHYTSTMLIFTHASHGNCRALAPPGTCSSAPASRLTAPRSCSHAAADTSVEERGREGGSEGEEGAQPRNKFEVWEVSQPSKMKKCKTNVKNPIMMRKQSQQ